DIDPAIADIPSFAIGLPGQLQHDENVDGYSIFSDNETGDASLVRADPVGASLVEVTDAPGEPITQEFSLEDTIVSYRDNAFGDTVVTLDNGESVVLRES